VRYAPLVALIVTVGSAFAVKPYVSGDTSWTIECSTGNECEQRALAHCKHEARIRAVISDFASYFALSPGGLAEGYQERRLTDAPHPDRLGKRKVTLTYNCL
jgi:hypothetical protein